jgi:hypothetical protein
VLVNSTPMHAHAAHPRLNPHFKRAEKSSWDVGSVAHMLLLEGHRDRVKVIEADSYKKKDAQEERDAARDAGLVPVLTKDFERVEAAVSTIRTQLEARDVEIPLLGDGKAEQTLIWQERGVTCRALVDWLHNDFLAIDDLKTTTTSANPVIWANRQIKAIGADVQVAFYRRGVKALTDQDPEFRYIVAESEPPFAVSVVSLAPTWMELGEVKVERAINRWRDCMANDDWPGYPDTTYYAEAPAWAEIEFLELDGEALNA